MVLCIYAMLLGTLVTKFEICVPDWNEGFEKCCEMVDKYSSCIRRIPAAEFFVANSVFDLPMAVQTEPRCAL